MTDWTAGYVADIGYTYGCYSELNPQRLRLAFLNAGLAFPKVGTACELGFGQGVSTNIHAAASVTQWFGTDFNPSQAAFAQELASASESGAKLYDDAFADFCSRPELPDFDYIGLHGIWSWISDENRKIIVEFIRRKLKVGGVLYISYNTLPGWSGFAPMRHLMTQHAEVVGSSGHGIVSRIDGALAFAEKLLATNPVYLRANPNVAHRLGKVKEQDREYLAHEYFNRDWHPMHFATMAEWLGPAKVNYACSAHYHDHIDILNLTQDQSALLSEIADPMFRESVRDFMVNQQFRRDYWVKGVRNLTYVEQVENLRATRIILSTHRDHVSLKIPSLHGEAEMSEAVYGPILNILSDHQPRSMGDIERSLRERGISLAQLTHAVMVLTGAGYMGIVQDDEVIAASVDSCKKLNHHIIRKARSNATLNFLASPVTGGGTVVGRFPQLFLLAMSEGMQQPSEWVQFAWQTISSQGQAIIKEGRLLETAEENLAELSSQARTFVEKQLPILRALQVV